MGLATALRLAFSAVLISGEHCGIPATAQDHSRARFVSANTEYSRCRDTPRNSAASRTDQPLLRRICASGSPWGSDGCVVMFHQLHGQVFGVNPAAPAKKTRARLICASNADVCPERSWVLMSPITKSELEFSLPTWSGSLAMRMVCTFCLVYGHVLAPPRVTGLVVFCQAVGHTSSGVGCVMG